MGEGIAGLENAYNTVFIATIVILAVMILLCLIRAVRGPRITDRIVTVNMMGTMVMVIISILALKKQENYLVDICLIYAMISFLAVIVISKVYMGVYMERKANGALPENSGEKSEDKPGEVPVRENADTK